MTGCRWSQSSQLPDCLVDDRGGSAGQIEAADFRMHGQLQRSCRLGFEHCRWQSSSFTAQDQYIASPERRLPDGSPSGTAQEPHRPIAETFHQDVPVLDRFPFDLGSVVHASAAKVFCVESESEWPDQPQVRTGGKTTAADIPGVGGNLWLVEDHIQGGRVDHNW